MKSVRKRITKEKYSIIGKRIRDEMKYRKLSRKDMIKILYPNGEIKSENTISQMCTGIDRHFNLDHIYLLANEWGVTKEYLLCESNHKTLDEKIYSMYEDTISTDALLIKLLEKRGHIIQNVPFPLDTYSANEDNSININGILLSSIDFMNITEDIYKHIDFILANAESYVDRRNLCVGYEYSKSFKKEDSLTNTPTET